MLSVPVSSQCGLKRLTDRVPFAIEINDDVDPVALATVALAILTLATL